MPPHWGRGGGMWKPEVLQAQRGQSGGGGGWLGQGSPRGFPAADSVSCLPEALTFPPTLMVEVCIKQTDLKRPPQDSLGQEQPLGPLLLDSVT